MWDHLVILPPELQDMVVHRLPQETLKDMCLVSKSCRDLAVPVLWKIFASDLTETNTRQLDTILTHKPGGFFANVRELRIRRSDDETPSNGWDLIFLQLISATKPDTLTSVFVVGEVNRQTLGLLLMRQKSLVELSAPIIDGRCPPHLGYVKGNLQLLRCLEIQYHVDYNTWLENTPMLEALMVSGSQPLQASVFDSWNLSNKLQRLKSLNLHNMTLQSGSGRITTWAAVQALSDLTIRQCKGVESFLKDFCSAHNDAQKRCHLTSLAISDNGDINWMISLNSVLHITSGLKYLYLSSACSELPLLHSLGSQRDHLSILLLDPVNDWSEIYHVKDGEAKCKYKDLSKLSKSCPLLQELGTSLVLVDFDEWHMMEPWILNTGNSSFDPDTEYVEKQILKQLAELATFSNLRVLRLTQAPYELYNFGEGHPRRNAHHMYHERRWRYGQFAEQIMQNLVKAGSKIQLLAFSPTVLQPEEHEFEDGNGHIWPNYYYLRGETTHMLPGRRQVTQVSAIPVRKDKIVNYMPWPKVLDDP